MNSDYQKAQRSTKEKHGQNEERTDAPVLSAPLVFLSKHREALARRTQRKPYTPVLIAATVHRDGLLLRNANSPPWIVREALEPSGAYEPPTAFPARRAWLHSGVRGQNGQIVFESGALNPDGSIVGNDNDLDPSRFEPHYSEIPSPDQVQIYESILKDQQGNVTTGLLSAVGYLKDNRVLPYGFDKAGAKEDIRVRGRAESDANFTAEAHRIRYSIALGTMAGPFAVEAELWYQPIGYRWANNLKPYDRAPEPSRFNTYYDSMDDDSAIMLARAEATHS